jgi:hypothetical protein
MKRVALPVPVALLVSLILAPRSAMLTSRTSRGRGYWTIRARRHYATHFTAASCRKGDNAGAGALYQQSLDILGDVGDKQLIAACLEGLAATVL